MDAKKDVEKKFDEWMSKVHSQIYWNIENITEDTLKEKLYNEVNIFESFKEGFEAGFKAKKCKK